MIFRFTGGVGTETTVRESFDGSPSLITARNCGNFRQIRFILLLFWCCWRCCGTEQCTGLFITMSSTLFFKFIAEIEITILKNQISHQMFSLLSCCTIPMCPNQELDVCEWPCRVQVCPILVASKTILGSFCTTLKKLHNDVRHSFQASTIKYLLLPSAMMLLLLPNAGSTYKSNCNFYRDCTTT